MEHAMQYEPCQVRTSWKDLGLLVVLVVMGTLVFGRYYYRVVAWLPISTDVVYYPVALQPAVLYRGRG